ncbi:MAG: cellulase family glycosylhydrolase [Hyphomicrobiaceae bacterium]
MHAITSRAVTLSSAALLFAVVLAISTYGALTRTRDVPENILRALRQGGVNLVYDWYDVPKYKPDAFDAELPLIRAAGGGHVRLVISMDVLEDARSGKLRDERWQDLKRFIGKARAHGLVTIVDVHNTGQKNADGSWTHDYMHRLVYPEMQSRHSRLLGELAARIYKETDRDWVIVDPANEPQSNIWYAYQDRLMPIIRHNCPDCVIFAMASKWQVPEETVRQLNPRERPWWDERFMVDIHMYAPLSLTHCSFPGKPNTCGGKTWPGVYDDGLPGGGRYNGLWDKEILGRSLQSLWDWSKRLRVQLHFSEIGTAADLADGPRSAYLRDVISLLRANGAGWTCYDWHQPQFGIKNAPATKDACLRGPRTTPPLGKNPG